MGKLPVENMISLCNCNSSWLGVERGLEVVPLASESLPQASLVLEHELMQPYHPRVFFVLENNEIDDGDDEDKNHGSNCSPLLTYTPKTVATWLWDAWFVFILWFAK